MGQIDRDQRVLARRYRCCRLRLPRSRRGPTRVLIGDTQRSLPMTQERVLSQSNNANARFLPAGIWWHEHSAPSYPGNPVLHVAFPGPPMNCGVLADTGKSRKWPSKSHWFRRNHLVWPLLPSRFRKDPRSGSVAGYSSGRSKHPMRHADSFVAKRDKDKRARRPRKIASILLSQFVGDAFQNLLLAESAASPVQLGKPFPLCGCELNVEFGPAAGGP